MDLDVKIRIENFGLRYSDGTESLNGITLDIYANQINVLFGPSGGGKSTHLAGDEPPERPDRRHRADRAHPAGRRGYHAARLWTSCSCGGAWASSSRGPSSCR